MLAVQQTIHVTDDVLAHLAALAGCDRRAVRRELSVPFSIFGDTGFDIRETIEDERDNGRLYPCASTYDVVSMARDILREHEYFKPARRLTGARVLWSEDRRACTVLGALQAAETWFALDVYDKLALKTAQAVGAAVSDTRRLIQVERSYSKVDALLLYDRAVALAQSVEFHHRSTHFPEQKKKPTPTPEQGLFGGQR